MKILITGGAGFIGSHLADKLLKRGDKVLVVDNFATGRKDNLKRHKHLKLVKGTIASEKLVKNIINNFKPKIVVHAAASYKDPDKWKEDVRTNILGTSLIIKYSLENKVQRIIYFQTALCYGLKPLEQPITLNHPLNPGASSYAISKTAGEYYIALSGIDFISFRLANAYGPRNLSGPLPTFYHRLSNNLDCFVMDTRRDFIYVDDLIRVVIKAIDGKGKKGYYHVSSGRDFAIKELFDATVKAMGLNLKKKVEVRKRNPDDAYTILLDPKKTQKDFNWKVKTPLTKGVKAAIDWYKAYGITQTYTHLKALSKSK